MLDKFGKVYDVATLRSGGGGSGRGGMMTVGGYGGAGAGFFGRGRGVFS